MSEKVEVELWAAAWEWRRGEKSIRTGRALFRECPKSFKSVERFSNPSSVVFKFRSIISKLPDRDGPHWGRSEALAVAALRLYVLREQEAAEEVVLGHAATLAAIDAYEAFD